MKNARILSISLLVSITAFCRIGPSVSAAAADVPHVVFVIHEKEYDTKQTLPEFARTELVEPLGWKCTFLHGEGENDIPGLEALESADLMFLSVRRQALPKGQLDRIRAYCRTGRPVVGIRTASHSFVLRNNEPPEGHDQWPEFDPEVLGGNYTGHHGNKGRSPDEPRTRVRIVQEAADHPVLKGVRRDEFEVTSWLYKVLPLEPSATPLLMGRVGDLEPEQPVAWVNRGKWGNRVFYTSLGHPDEFKDPDFRRLLVNGIHWALGRDIP